MTVHQINFNFSGQVWDSLLWTAPPANAPGTVQISSREQNPEFRNIGNALVLSS